MRQLKTVRRPPIYPNGAQAISPASSLTPLLLSSRRPSVDSGLGARLPSKPLTIYYQPGNPESAENQLTSDGSPNILPPPVPKGVA